MSVQKANGTPQDAWSTVYVVDPDEAVRRSMSSLLRAHDYEVRTFASGRDLLEGLDSGDSGCLVMEINLPDISGFDLLDRLAERDTRLPVIVVASEADVAIAVRAMRCGASDFLEKPFATRVLVESIGRALDSADRTRTGRD